MQQPPTCGEHVGTPLLSQDVALAQADASKAAAGTTSGGDAATQQVTCWACGVAVQVPMAGELPAPIFKCGWCGAITEYMRAPARHRVDNAFRAIMRFLSHLKWGVVVLVTLLTFSIILPGAVGVLPVTCGHGVWFIFNHMITWLFSFNILYNFAACVFTSAGTVKDCYVLPVQPGQPIPQGAFNEFRYCYHCKYFKPATAHHCSMCRTCVVDMDHHCPFINNCVGRANLRNFIVFLIWVVGAMLFAMTHTGYLLFFKERYALIMSLERAWNMRRYPWDILLFTPFVILATPWRILIPLYVFSASTGVLVGVGVLLIGQIRYVYSEATSLHQHQQLQQQLSAQSTNGNGVGHAGTVGGAGIGTPGFRLGLSLLLARWQVIMGGPNPLHWLWPHWGPLPGVCGAIAKKDL